MCGWGWAHTSLSLSVLSVFPHTLAHVVRQDSLLLNPAQSVSHTLPVVWPCLCVAAQRDQLTLLCESENEWEPKWKEQDSGRWSEKLLCPTHLDSSSPASIEHREINLACALSDGKERSKTRGILLQPGDSFYLLTAPSSSLSPLPSVLCPSVSGFLSTVFLASLITVKRVKERPKWKARKGDKETT